MRTGLKKLMLFMFLMPLCILAKNAVAVPKLSGTISGNENVRVESMEATLLKVSERKGVAFVLQQQDTTKTGQDNQDVKTEDLEEVVVNVGYGSVKKKDATGSVSVLGVKEFNKGPVISADQMITGKVAGVQVIRGGGSPGESPTIRVRSGSSLTANNDPLYVIDNVPVATGGVEGGKNPLSTINPNDIASITVLKDASATAIYGSRASNGVIIITTKKGTSGAMKITYNGNFQASTITKYVDVLSADQFRGYVNQYGSESHKTIMGQASTDWQKEIYQTALGTDHSFSLSGGATKNITYRASVGYANINGILKRDNMERLSGNVALIGNFLENHLKIEVNSNNAKIKSNYSNTDAIGSAVSFDPTQVVENPDGTYYQWFENGKYNSLAAKNPVSLIEQKNKYGDFLRSTGNIMLDYKMHFLPELKAVGNFGYDYLDGRSYGDTSMNFINGLSGSGFGDTYENKEKRNNTLMDLYLNFNKEISSIKTSVDVTAGYTYQDFRDSKQKSNFNYENNQNTAEVYTPTRVNLQSFFARGNFTVMDRYLLTASLRRDGTSRFAKANRWSNFPAVAIGWKINEESFMSNVTSISSLKFRGGWGVTGQQDIGVTYPSLPTYLNSNDKAQYPLGGNYYNTIRPEPYNSNLKWEETTTLNAGFDFGLFGNRFSGSMDLYNRTTNDLLLYTYNPPFFGFSNQDNYNVGSIENKGVEISAQIVPIRSEDIEWVIGGNITFQDSKITKLTTTLPNTPGINTGDITGGTGNKIQNHQVGYAPNSFYVYEQVYGTDGKPLEGVFVDRNKDGVVDEQDKYRFQKPASDVFYGFYTTFTYKKWDAGINFRGSSGNYNYNNVDSNNAYRPAMLRYQNSLANATQDILFTNFASNDAKRNQSDYYIKDASFLRLDNINIGYTFDNLGEKMPVMKVTFAAQNVYVFTNYKGLDPEISNGLDNNLYPRPINFSLGLNVNF